MTTSRTARTASTPRPSATHANTDVPLDDAGDDVTVSLYPGGGLADGAVRPGRLCVDVTVNSLRPESLWPQLPQAGVSSSRSTLRVPVSGSSPTSTTFLTTTGSYRTPARSNRTRTLG